MVSVYPRSGTDVPLEVSADGVLEVITDRAEIVQQAGLQKI